MRKLLEEHLAVLLAAVTLFVWQIGPQIDFDLWFDLRLGEYIVQTRSIPHHTMFLSTGMEFSLPWWSDDEWGFCVLTWLCWCLGGYLALAVLKAGLITALGAVIYVTCRHQKMAALPAIGFTGVMILLMRSRFMLRPQLVSDLMLALLVLLLIGPMTRRRALWTVPLFLVWGNMHGAVLAGLVLITLWTASSLVAGSDAAGRGALLTAWLLSWPAALCSPGNVHIFALAYEAMAAHRRSQDLIVEWDPLTLQHLWGPFGTFVLLGIVGFGCALARHAPWRPLLPRLVVLSAFTTLAVRHQRALGELSAVSALLAGPLVDAWAPLARRVKWRIPGTVTALCLIAVICAFLFYDVRGPDRFNLEPPNEVYPNRAIDLMSAHPIQGTVFNTYHFGGYLAWRGFSPFLHGMNMTYSEKLFDDYLAILGEAGQRPSLLARFDIGACVLAYPLGKDTTLEFIAYLAKQPDWHLVSWDDAALLFVRGPPPVTPYTAVNPALENPFVNGDMDAARREIERAGREAPKARIPRLMLAELELRLKNNEAALVLCEDLLARDPTDYQVWMKRGVAHFQMGMVGDAIDDLRKAVRYDDRSAISRYDLGLACAAAARATRQQGHTADADRYLGEAVTSLHECLVLDPNFAPAAELLRQLQ